MLVKEIFEMGLKMSIKKDPRGENGVKKYLERIKKEYEDMKPSDKEFYDITRLSNPYMDSQVQIDDGKTQVKRVLAGIDITEAEILLATQLNERGKKIDLVLAHHPLGKSRADLSDVMDMSVAVFEDLGVPVHLAEKIMDERIREVGRSLHAVNHYKTVDIAQILKVNLINTHTITDNLVNNCIIDYLAKKKPKTVKDLVDALVEIPEYREAKKMGFGPKIFAGNPQHHIGKILVEMTGGTNPSSKVYEELSRAGISTLVGMHMQEETLKKVDEHGMNVIIAGHISSDSVGMNLFLDELEKKGVEVVPCGGLIRVNRNKKK